MDSFELKEINERLKVWRGKRNIDMDMQKESLIVNLLEEFVEFSRAESEYEKIDALCDMCIFILNAYEIDYVKIYSIRYNYNDKFEILHLINDLAMRNDKCNASMIIDCIIDYLDSRNYDLYLCLCETLKEIESRQGSYDAVKKKWVKDSNIETYKADYRKCKIKEII